MEVLDRRRRGAGVADTLAVTLAVTLSGPAANLLLGAGLLLAFRASADFGVEAGLASFLQHGVSLSSAPGQIALLLGGASQLYLGALSLVPLPPLDGGRLLFALSPQTPGWQKAQHYLVEQNIGIAVLLALLLIPLGGPLPLLPQVLDAVLGPLIRVLTGG